MGIDLGSSSIKIVVIEQPNTPHIVTLHNQSLNFGNLDGSRNSPLFYEENVEEIITILCTGLKNIPLDLQKQIKSIGVCGQMHGILFWSNKHSQNSVFPLPELSENNVSPLYTWQDQRCSPEFLKQLPKAESQQTTSTGFGIATSFWLLQRNPEVFEKQGFFCNFLIFLYSTADFFRFESAGTIHDFVVALLCDLDQPVMSPQNAASWGYFNSVTNTWNVDMYHVTNTCTCTSNIKSILE